MNEYWRNKMWANVAIPSSPIANSESSALEIIDNQSWRVPPRRVIVQGFFPCKDCMLRDFNCEAFRTANGFEMMLNSPYKSADVVQGCGMVTKQGESK